ncbi:hydrolase, NUDIX domain containing protein [Acanthamoeba castellanii str. Neff]|uniref:Hydrolase, NUDIX domain containing protein n=1 Tax=Acanthamoeba castellanii (strain ATCC 30010 / Neff) TaxID=1257118 RepID=L8H9P8_ACACF|nr:hydrolase, NUDIX domain containing protein [Acanthamoeba castellanii str. Neff]ELR21131.1 hydrolase, NUDIX domain containing protein [Acanthamoeba castellanii str. Neff]
MELVRGLLGYRACLGACIFDGSGRILVGKRSSAKKQAVGTGGYDKSADKGCKVTGVWREVWEEIGLTPDHGLHLVDQLKEELKQSMTWFLFYWADADLSKCKLDNEEHPEFTELAWKDWDFAVEHVMEAKKGVYTKLRAWAEPAIASHLASLE